jgi:hypothetical protein
MAGKQQVWPSHAQNAAAVIPDQNWQFSKFSTNLFWYKEWLHRLTKPLLGGNGLQTGFLMPQTIWGGSASPRYNRSNITENSEYGPQTTRSMILERRVLTLFEP